MRQRNEGVLFAFLSHQQRDVSSILDILKSFIFQLLYEYPGLRPVMQKAYDEDFRELQSSLEYNQQLFCNLIESAGPMFVIIDGLDEILEKERKAALNCFIEITKKCSNFKVMISSREESDISHILRSRAILLKIGSKNSRDISRYCDNQISAWLDNLDVDERTSKELTALAKGVTNNSKGMIL
jgi:ATP/maltotriose-dependent transcriptional regulator MalT